jgi:ABC-2 type transport system permease protein
MVVAAAAATGRPRASDFVRLKLRLTRNSFRGQSWRVVVFVLGLLSGLFLAAMSMLGLAATRFAPTDVGYLIAVFVGGFIILGWTLVPLLFFGVDETLDPARFALLPIRRGTLARGMLAAAFVGVPALVTLLGMFGLVLAAGLRFGRLEALAALVGVAAGLALGVVASRAVTSAFAALLRSRRVRDLAAVIIALLASSIGPLQWLITALAQRSDLKQALRIADVVSWSPFGAPFVLPYDVAVRRWDLAASRLAIALATLLLLLWWWSHTLESAMLETSSGGPTKPIRTGSGAVAALLPRSVRAMTRPGPFAAILARESRFWWRDGRRRASLVSILMASAVLPIALTFGTSQGGPGAARISTVGFGFAVTMAGTMGGMLLGNQFGFDGNAYASHMLSRVPGRTELRARAAAIAVVAVPVQIVVVVAVAALSDQVGLLPTGLGLLAASFGSAVAASALLSVLAPYPLPENSNPFAMNSGGGTAKGMLAIVALIGTLVLSMPVAVPAFLFGSSPEWTWLLLAGGLGYGLGMAWLGTYIAGDVLERRGPEVLAAVTPRR